MDGPRHTYSSSDKKLLAPSGTQASSLQSQQPPLVPLLSHVNPVHNLRSTVTLFFSLWQGLPSGLCPSALPIETHYASLLLPIHDTCPTHLLLLDLVTQKISDDKYKPWSSSLWNFLQSPVTPPLKPQYIPQQTILRHPQLIIFPSCGYKITGGSCSLFYGKTHVPGGAEKNH